MARAQRSLPQPRAPAVSAREQAVARGRADGRRRMSIGEPHALPRQPVNVRRLDLGGTITTDIPVAEVVGHDDDDVWCGRFGGVQYRLRRDQQSGNDLNELFHLRLNRHLYWFSVKWRNRCRETRWTGHQNRQGRFPALVPIPQGQDRRHRAAPLRSWPPGRRSGRVATSPYPPPGSHSSIDSSNHPDNGSAVINSPAASS